MTNRIVDVKHFLVNYATITPYVFTFPILHELFPHIAKITDAVEQPLDTLVPKEYQVLYHQLAHALRDMFRLLELETEIYSMGEASHLVASHLLEIVKETSYQTSKKAVLFLVDRVSPFDIDLNKNQFLDARSCYCCCSF